MEEKDAHFRLRIPSDLKEWVDEQARANNRSINAEITWMLQFMRDERAAFEAEEKAEAAEAKRIALEALRIAKETRAAWENNALAKSISQEKGED
ncbi:Arc family DNA-binding protein [Kozakia baliensis]|uniref:Arc family DNA-binding protein n=1 Tax=Kozakia baliensis TaxID=153496 RepID=UPI000495DDBE|nr:Arc family DNA-binding protein [Kozakia baliensis]